MDGNIRKEQESDVQPVPEDLHKDVTIGAGELHTMFDGCYSICRDENLDRLLAVRQH